MGAVKHKGNTNRANRVKGNLRPGEVKRVWNRGMESVEEQRRVDGNLGCMKKP